MNRVAKSIAAAISEELMRQNAWIEGDDFNFDGLVEAARSAALLALREPTPEMVEAGFAFTTDPCWPGDLAKAFTAMIDAERS